MCPDKELFSAYVDGEVPEPQNLPRNYLISHSEK